MSGQSGHPSLVPVSHWVSYKKNFLFNLTISKNIIMLVNKSITYPCTVGTVDTQCRLIWGYIDKEEEEVKEEELLAKNIQTLSYLSQN